jgi:hypothetical protein
MATSFQQSMKYAYREESDTLQGHSTSEWIRSKDTWLLLRAVTNQMDYSANGKLLIHKVHLPVGCSRFSRCCHMFPNELSIKALSWKDLERIANRFEWSEVHFPGSRGREPGADGLVEPGHEEW